MAPDWSHLVEVGVGAVIAFAAAWGFLRARVGGIEKDAVEGRQRDKEAREKDADECRKGIAGLQATLAAMNATLIGLNSMVNTLMPERLRQVEDLREEVRDAKQSIHKLRETLQKVLVDISERVARLEGNSTRHVVDLVEGEDA